MQPPLVKENSTELVLVPLRDEGTRTIYPISLLKEIAQAIFEKAGDEPTKNFSAKVRELDDDQLDCSFVRFFPRLMRQVLYPTDERLLGLEREGILFKRLIKIGEKRNALNQTVLTYDLSKYRHACVEQTLAKEALIGLAAKIEEWKGTSKGNLGKQEYREKEQAFLIKEAHLLIFAELLQDQGNGDLDKQWKEHLGTASTTAATFLIENYFKSHFIINCLVTGANYLGVGIAPYVRSEVDQITQRILNERKISPDKWTLIPTDSPIKVSHQFDGLSSTMWGRMWGRASLQRGILRLEVGPWVFHYDYFLQNPSPLSKIDLTELQVVLLKSVDAGYVKIEQIDPFLTTLRTHNPPFVTEIDIEQHFYLLRYRAKIS